MKPLLFLFSLLLNSESFAQTFENSFAGDIPGFGYDMRTTVQQTFDGGYILGGVMYKFNTQSKDYCIVKLDADGDTLWTKIYGHTSPVTSGYIEQTPDSGFIYFSNDYGTYVMKFDEYGDTVWVSNIHIGETRSIVQSDDGGYLLTGQGNDVIGPSYGDYIFLCKLNQVGDTVWTKIVGAGNVDNEVRGGYALQTFDGGYMILGGVVIGPDDNDIFMLKINALGDTLWTKSYGVITSNFSSYDIGTCIRQTADSGYIIIGTSSSHDTTFNADIYLLKTNSNGDTLWTRFFGSYGSWESASDIRQTMDGGYIVTGIWNDRLGLMKLNSSGDTIWTRNFTGGGAYSAGYSVFQTLDSGYVISGVLYTNNGDFYCIKTDANGTLNCSEDFGPVEIAQHQPQTANNHIVHDFWKVSYVPPNIFINLFQGCITANVCTTSTTSIESASLKPDLVITPNPAHLKFIVEISSASGTNEQAGLEIYNALGQIVYSATFLDKSHTVNQKFLPGLYLITVLHKGKLLNTRVVVN